MSKTIFIVEDEEDITELIKYNLSKEGFDTLSCNNGAEAALQIEKAHPDLVLLDLMLPGMGGLEVCKTLKQHSETKDIPIIMLTAKSEEADIVTGLELGADDYLTKPFSPRILTARIKAVLRRQGSKAQEPNSDIVIPNGLISPSRREIILDGKAVDLTYSEFQTLLLLAENPGRVFTRYQIVSEVHGHDYAVTDRSIDVLMVSLRKKLGDSAALIETIRGVGYRFKD